MAAEQTVAVPKAAVKALRRGFWSTWWTAVKRGVVIVLVGVVLVVWSAREVSRNQDGATPVPASVTPAPSPS
jgi:hypothetical protein